MLFARTLARTARDLARRPGFAVGKRRFDGETGVLGRTLVLSGRPTRVVGVK